MTPSELRSGPPGTLRELWAAARRQPLAFWCLCFYVIVEYWRLHAAYPALDFVPWGQLALGLCLAAFLIQKRPARAMVPLDWIVLLFFGWVAVTSLMAWDSAHSWSTWTTWVGWALLYFFVSRIPTTPKAVFLFVLFFLIVNLKMSQHGARTFLARGLSFADWGATGSPGWFQNSGEFAMQMAGFMALSWCLLAALRPVLRTWHFYSLVVLFPGTAAISVLASSSRGGQLAALVAIVLLLVLSRVKLRAIVIGVACVALAWAVVPDEQKTRFSTMGDDDTSQSRLTYWDDAWEITGEHPVFGIGVGNWVAYYGGVYGADRVEVVHNTYLEASTELGYPGLLLFLAAVAASFVMNHDTRSRARSLARWREPVQGIAIGLDMMMVAFLIAAMFMSVLFYPIFWMSFGMASSLSSSVRRSARVSPKPTHGIRKSRSERRRRTTREVLR